MRYWIVILAKVHETKLMRDTWSNGKEQVQDSSWLEREEVNPLDFPLNT